MQQCTNFSHSVLIKTDIYIGKPGNGGVVVQRGIYRLRPEAVGLHNRHRGVAKLGFNFPRVKTAATT